MAIIHRRVFMGKVGVADQLIAHIREGNNALSRFGGVDFKARVLSDYVSGRTDRVVMEWEVANLGEVDAALGRVMANPQGQAWLQSWFQKLGGLIDYAEVENWTIN